MLDNSAVPDSGKLRTFGVFFTKRSVIVLVGRGTDDTDSGVSSFSVNTAMNRDIVG